MLAALRADAQLSKPSPGQPVIRVVSESGVAKWTDEHEAAAWAALRAAFDQTDPLVGPLAAPILALVDLVTTYTAAPQNLDLLLSPISARVSTSDDDVRFGVLTPLTDVDDLLERALGRSPARPRYRMETPTISVTLGQKLDPVEIAEYLGLTPRELAGLWRSRPTRDQVRKFLDALIQRLTKDSPPLGAILASVRETDSEALMDFPLVRVLLALLRGVRPPAKGGRMALVHLVELDRIGELAFVIVSPTVRADARLRAAVSAHLRYLADRRVAPWLRWKALRERREAFTLYARRVRGERPGVHTLGPRLQRLHPTEYEGEPVAVTERRLYRISSEIRKVSIPPSIRRHARELMRHDTGSD